MGGYRLTHGGTSIRACQKVGHIHGDRIALVALPNDVFSGRFGSLGSGDASVGMICAGLAWMCRGRKGQWFATQRSESLLALETLGGRAIPGFEQMGVLETALVAPHPASAHVAASAGLGGVVGRPELAPAWVLWLAQRRHGGGGSGGIVTIDGCCLGGSWRRGGCGRRLVAFCCLGLPAAP